MSLGIKSIWRARARCSSVAGPLLISRDPLPSRVPNQCLTTLRFESSPTPTPLDLATTPSTSITLSSNKELGLHVGDVSIKPLSVASKLVIDEKPESKN